MLAFVAVGLIAACGTGCVLARRAINPADGGSVAQDAAEEQAQRLSTRLGYRDRPRDAESIAATEVTTDPGTQNADAAPQTTQLVPLAWSGRVYADERATIDVRFTVTVTAYDPPVFGARGNSAGSATRCYRYTLQLYRDTTHREIGCPAVADPPRPSAAPVLRLPADASDRLAAALRGATTPQSLAGAVRAAFPQDGFTVDTATAGDTLVAAVGVPAERDCVVMIRTAGGATEAVGYDPVQLEPGETGCRTALYTHPVR